MAVLTNTMLQGTAADTGDGDDYQIERSLKFNKAESAHLTRTPNRPGNQRTWTYATWFKRIDPGTKQIFFGISNAGSGYAMSVELASDEIYVYIGEDAATYYVSSSKYRDPSAWYHLVVAYDSNQPRVKDRIRVYINGETVPNPTTNAAPTVGHKGAWNRLAKHYINATSSSQNDSDSQLADTYFIDGMQLHASAFGTRDSAGIWKPKEFAIPKINDGTVWSTPSYWSGTEKSDAPYDYGFDGHTGSSTSGTTATIAKIDNSATTGFVNYDFTPPNPITFVDTVEICAGISSVRYSINGEPFVWGTNTGDWFTIASGGGTLTTLNIEADNHYPEWRGVRIDGVVLIDNTHDVTGRNNPNDGTEWSSGTEAGTALGSSDDADNAFDGLTDDSNSMLPATGSTYSVTLPHSVTVKERVRLHCHTGSASAYAKVYITPTGGSNTAYSTSGSFAEAQWKELFTGTGELTKVEVVADGSNRAGIQAVEVDGHILVDNVADNSFRLNYNATGSITRYIGKDTLNGKIEDATGGLPIHNTTDDYGDVKGSGYRADSSAGTTDGTGLIFAMPGDTLTDIHASINTGSSNKALTNVGTVATTTAESRFYGSCLDMTGVNAQYLHTTDSSSDFTFGNGSFTIECWFKYTVKDTSSPGLFQLSSAGAGSSNYAGGIYVMLSSNNNNVYVNVSDDQTGYTPTNSLKSEGGTWNHFALVGEGGNKVRVYLNGVLSLEKSGDYVVNNATYLTLGKYYNNDNYNFGGYINDFRVYKGVAKYDANFITPTRNDWTVHNLTPAGGTSGHAGPWNTGFKSGGQGTWSGQSAITPSSGYSLNTNGNNNRLSVDTTALGDVYNIKIENTGGANDIYIEESDDGSSWTNTINNIDIIILSNSGDTYDGTDVSTINNAGKRYRRFSGAGGGYVTMTVTGTAFGDSASKTDVLVDSPTIYGEESDPTVGGELRGNFCTMNPLDKHNDQATDDGNLVVKPASSSWGGIRGTLGVNSGKWYYELKTTTASLFAGIATAGVDIFASAPQDTTSVLDDGALIFCDDGKYLLDLGGSGNRQNYSSALADGDILGVAFDLDGNTAQFYKNGSALGSIDISSSPLASKTVFPYVVSYYDNKEITFNFGQRAFKHTPPSGYKCLCAANLDDTFDGAQLNNPSKYFDVKIFNGSAGAHTIPFGFQPDLIWHKEMDNAQWHMLMDSVRGEGSEGLKKLYSNEDDNEDSSFYDSSNKVTLDGNGVKLWSNGHVNTSGDDFVLWCWDAGSAGAANNDGSINVTNQWKNATAGFSITKYEGTGANATVGHGLGVPPELIIIKAIGLNGQPWVVGHNYYHDTAPWAYYTHLNANSSANTLSSAWQDTAPTNTVFSIGSTGALNTDDEDHIAYCWAPIKGFSAFGSFWGNGNANGPFIYTGFQPRWIMTKNTTTSRNWVIWDTERSPVNFADECLFPDTNDDQDTKGPDGSSDNDIDIVSNGFKIRNADHSQNENTSRIVYAAFAEHPFKTARAR